MLRRTSLLVSVHIMVLTAFAYFAGAFGDRIGVIQFFGHLGPAMLFAGAGLISISGKIDTRRLIQLEAYLALGAASMYVLVDTFIIHSPFGIFRWCGHSRAATRLPEPDAHRPCGLRARYAPVYRSTPFRSDSDCGCSVCGGVFGA